jgi:cold shock CspA family protein
MLFPNCVDERVNIAICDRRRGSFMRSLGLVRACLVATVLNTTNALAAGPFGTIHVGLWKGGAYTNDSTGAFMHCAAGSDYVNGVGLILGQQADRSWLLGFISASWDMTQGTTYPIDLIFDGQAQFRVFGNAVNPKLISAPFPETAANRLRRSHLMVATGNTRTFQFDVRPPPQRLRGKVKWFDPDKGFGFIVRKDSNDVFFHIRQVADECDEPRQGDSVSFFITAATWPRITSSSKSEDYLQGSGIHRRDARNRRFQDF